MYNDKDYATVMDYANRQLARIEEPGITEDEREFMHATFMRMYANPLINKLKKEVVEV